MKRIEELKMYREKIEDFSDKLGEEILDAVYEDDNFSSDMGKYVIREFLMCETDREVEVANNMLIAITGYSLETLLLRTVWKQAQENAREEYEEEWCEGSWEDLEDKYERQDHVWAAYEKLKGDNK